LKIRKTTESDLYDVLSVEKDAFGNEKGPEIADLVNGLLLTGGIALYQKLGFGSR
jgi:hypothetical protein